MVGFMAGFLLFTLSVTLLALSTADPSAQSIPFQRSLNLSRKIMQDVRELLITYKREKIGNAAFEDYNVDLKSLPRFSNVYSYWLQMQDVERLQCNAKDLNIFWVHVDFKRVDEMGECQQCVLSKSIEVVSLDLRDLVSQLRSQIQALNSSLAEPAEFSIPISTPSGSNTWLSNLQGYIIFRDLGTYLNKVIRDLTLLSTKYQA